MNFATLTLAKLVATHTHNSRPFIICCICSTVCTGKKPTSYVGRDLEKTKDWDPKWSVINCKFDGQLLGRLPDQTSFLETLKFKILK